ncbi:MAG TPA: hypothetical protein VGN27_01485 [Gaiellaceae bacterium]|jgi:hypothetical protein|nr:hypothetical protein [Gaiellaceae bacterium]
MNEFVKRARTEALFRDVNERIAENAERFNADTTQFVCECANPDCTHRLEASLDEYEDVRADGATFMLKPGHEHADIERVIERRDGFHIVEKVHSLVRETVHRLNPRAA